ncbi:hypothetical protein H8B06_05980 [Sphingobacterium sp. DN00404]|uniref:Uncharacterized protein n=1 Tax=Sphingobacterium micropteri TaxID=2763501 RepID=A0ABR7YMB3_9SPHI|nr:hypothetical protein [Sphingobacterium micropteri]MBD1432366.1 hypothetical protein [Sphingobacterium micropteri]
MEIQKITNMCLTQLNPVLADVNVILKRGGMVKFKIKFEDDMSNFDIMHPDIDTQSHGDENRDKIWDYYQKEKSF